MTRPLLEVLERCDIDDAASIDNLLDRNYRWVERKTGSDPDYFARLA